MILRADEEQAQGLLANDPTLMADTATAEYYLQLVKTNHDLVSNGVAAIQLASVEWGAVEINGNTATATCWETWSTTYSDATSEQARYWNVYTLERQADGTWKIQANEHPDQTGTPSLARVPGRPTAVPPLAPQPTSPSLPGSESQSRNWAGYAATGGVFTGVSATWRVPEFSATSGAGVDATWVGIGGVQSTDLLQAGTEQETSGTGSTRYQAWVELLTQPSQPVQLAIHPGDSISISISYQGQA